MRMLEIAIREQSLIMRYATERIRFSLDEILFSKLETETKHFLFSTPFNLTFSISTQVYKALQHLVRYEV